MNKQTVAVVGFGKTGQALLDFLLYNRKCREQYHKILLFNDHPIGDGVKQKEYEKKGVLFAIGETQFSRLQEADLVVLSPGVDGRTKRFSGLRSKNAEIVSEIEFASRFFTAKIVSVTGTNGKSTTVTLLHHILQENGIDSLLLGNIGQPLISAVDKISPDSTLVLELSSFQLEEINRFHSHTAVILNVTPDHLDRYQSLEDYFSAKLNIFKNQTPKDHMILNYGDPLLKGRRGSLGPGQETWFSLKDPGLDRCAYVEAGHLVLKREGKIGRVSLRHNPLRGVHNLENLLAAAAAASLHGIPAEGIEKSIADFQGLPHRMEGVGKIGCVEFINDSKATNVDAALKSIDSIDDATVLILGGKDKGGDFTKLEHAIKEKIVKVLLVGQASRTIYDQLPAAADKCSFSRDLEEAVAAGYACLKEKGGVVLLAPGCASFDMFDNFEHRGRAFKEAYQKLIGEIEHG